MGHKFWESAKLAVSIHIGLFEIVVAVAVQNAFHLEMH
jgi:hypothetical protein